MQIISEKAITNVAFHLLSRTATQYPKNNLQLLLHSYKREQNKAAKNVIGAIIENILQAVQESASICQDTGIPTFHIYLNPAISIQGDVNQALVEATIRATEEIPLRKNVIEPFSFENSGNNAGWGTPFIHFHFNSNPGPMRIRAELKGFGGELKSSADWIFTSTENMENAVLSYVLNNMLLSKGEACMPGFIGIGVGGYASEAATNAKNAVFRELLPKSNRGSSHADGQSLRHFEHRILRCINSMGLGPMGGGGNTTALSVSLETRGAHTAASSVAVCQQCWASRASEALVGENSVEFVTSHLQVEDVPSISAQVCEERDKSNRQGKVIELETPIHFEKIADLRVGDVVYLTGTICTARDRAHRRMVDLVREGKREKIPPEILDNGVVYHCGPVTENKCDRWCINAAGPTTSSRFSDDAAILVENGLIPVSIGKGTMGAKMLDAIIGRGIYLKAVGGCAVTYKSSILEADVKWLDLGHPEAMWVFKVNRFGPLVVGIDSRGNNLSSQILTEVYENTRKLYHAEGLDPRKRYAQYPKTFAGLSLEEVIGLET